MSDPPRTDAAELVKELYALGVRTVMVTGDAPATAAIIAKAVGLDGAICPPGPIPESVHPEDFAVFAGILPEDKYHLVQEFQKSGHTVGMCGDGANDAPALRQAQMGIAVSTATDVAKSAAGIVLTKPGLEGVVAAVKEGRVTFQRILTYTLNSVTSKIAKVLFIAVGLILTGHAILTPMLMVIILITGDFLGMSMTTDNVHPSPKPNAWHIGNLTIAGVFMGLSELTFFLGVLVIGNTPSRSRDRGSPDSRFFGSCIRESSNHLRESNSSASLVDSPEFLAHTFVGSRSIDRLNHGIFWHSHGTVANTRHERNACRSGCLCIHGGHCQSPRIQSPEDCLTTENARSREIGIKRQSVSKRRAFKTYYSC